VKNMAGSIIRRGKSSFRLCVSSGFDSDGNRIRHIKTIRTNSRKEAEIELARFIAEVEDPQYVRPSKMKFREFTNKWLAEYAMPNLSERTIWGYQKHLEIRLIPYFGNMVMEQITPFVIQKFYNSLRRDNERKDGKTGKLSEMTIRQIHLFLSSLFEKAVKWQFISVNPIKRVDAPKVKKQNYSVYDTPQLDIAFEIIDKEALKYKLIFTLAAICGLRRGEVLGLRWSDVELTKRKLNINQVSQYIKDKGIIFKKPKTHNSQRILSIPEPLIGLFEEYRIEQDCLKKQVGSLWQNSELLFTQWDGTPMFPDSISKWFYRLVKKNKLPHLCFHGLRHTSASIMVSKGIDIKTVSGILGHADIQTTLNIYAHVLETKKIEAADKMADLIKLS